MQLRLLVALVAAQDAQFFSDPVGYVTSLEKQVAACKVPDTTRDIAHAADIARGHDVAAAFTTAAAPSPCNCPEVGEPAASQDMALELKVTGAQLDAETRKAAVAERDEADWTTQIRTLQAEVQSLQAANTQLQAKLTAYQPDAVPEGEVDAEGDAAMKAEYANEVKDLEEAKAADEVDLDVMRKQLQEAKSIPEAVANHTAEMNATLTLTNDMNVQLNSLLHECQLREATVLAKVDELEPNKITLEQHVEELTGIVNKLQMVNAEVTAEETDDERELKEKEEEEAQLSKEVDALEQEATQTKEVFAAQVAEEKKREATYEADVRVDGDKQRADLDEARALVKSQAAEEEELEEKIKEEDTAAADAEEATATATSEALEAEEARTERQHAIRAEHKSDRHAKGLEAAAKGLDAAASEKVKKAEVAEKVAEDKAASLNKQLLKTSSANAERRATRARGKAADAESKFSKVEAQAAAAVAAREATDKQLRGAKKEILDANKLVAGASKDITTLKAENARLLARVEDADHKKESVAPKHTPIETTPARMSKVRRESAPAHQKKSHKSHVRGHAEKASVHAEKASVHVETASTSVSMHTRAPGHLLGKHRHSERENSPPPPPVVTHAQEDEDELDNLIELEN